jgi:hypothetical protein
MTLLPVDPTLRRAFVAVALAGAALSCGALAAYGARVGLGTLAGALVAWVNLWLLSLTVGRVLAQQSGAIPLALVKLSGLLLVTYALVRVVGLDVLALAVGFGALPLGIVAAGALGGAASGGVASVGVPATASQPPASAERD